MVFLPYCCLQPSRFRGSPTAIKKLGSTVLFSPESLPEKPAKCFLQKVCSATANWNHVIGTWNCQGNWHRSVTGVKWGYLEIIGSYHVMLFWHKTDNPHHTKLTFLLWNEKFALPTLPPIVVSGLPEQRFLGASLWGLKQMQIYSGMLNWEQSHRVRSHHHRCHLFWGYQGAKLPLKVYG